MHRFAEGPAAQAILRGHGTAVLRLTGRLRLFSGIADLGLATAHLYQRGKPEKKKF
ncbi:MAG: hypothetical protein JOZ31_08415 [Verrucomicrobia bacterium]|nr:hypothetical protein [Verrucomicrobiota bacterium]MBV8483018.1 hypothetical protein [Verrucomicrobiota bacterium]